MPSANAGNWLFLSNHGNVLLCIARDPGARIRDIAQLVGITERAAQRIVADLVAGGYVLRSRDGRRNRYAIDRSGRLRHPLFHELEIGPLIDTLLDGGAGGRGRATKPSG